jgi:endonuclease/exonuclease/phosphatase family metal-dependent hydrolase
MVAAALSRGRAAADGLVIASYNVHGCVGVDGRWRPQRVADAIAELDADVVAVQEVHSNPGAPGGDELALLARQTDYAFLHGPTHARAGGAFGNGLLTRLPIVELRLVDLSQPRCEPRGAIDADLCWGAARVRVVATHLGLEPWERSAQCRLLLERLSPRNEADVSVLLGDFNEWWAPRPLIRALHAHFGRARAVRTYPSYAPLLRLDRIWVKPAHALRAVRAHRSRLARIASDHLPLRAVIELPAAEHSARIVQQRVAHGRVRRRESEDPRGRQFVPFAESVAMTANDAGGNDGERERTDRERPRPNGGGAARADRHRARAHRSDRRPDPESGAGASARRGRKRASARLRDRTSLLEKVIPMESIESLRAELQRQLRERPYWTSAMFVGLGWVIGRTLPLRAVLAVAGLGARTALAARLESAVLGQFRPQQREETMQ